jgi:HSP20 family protein
MSNNLIKRDFWNTIPKWETPLLDAFPGFFGTKSFFKGFDPDFEKIMKGKCDFEETDDRYVIELEVPGVKKDEINLNLKNEVLTIAWNSKKETKSSKGKSRYERSEGSFTRSFEVEGADVEKIEAELKNGVLKITLPKHENSKPKKIEIN